MLTREYDLGTSTICSSYCWMLPEQSIKICRRGCMKKYPFVRTLIFLSIVPLTFLFGPMAFFGLVIAVDIFKVFLHIHSYKESVPTYDYEFALQGVFVF